MHSRQTTRRAQTGFLYADPAHQEVLDEVVPGGVLKIMTHDSQRQRKEGGEELAAEVLFTVSSWRLCLFSFSFSLFSIHE